MKVTVLLEVLVGTHSLGWTQLSGTARRGVRVGRWGGPGLGAIWSGPQGPIQKQCWRSGRRSRRRDAVAIAATRVRATISLTRDILLDQAQATLVLKSPQPVVAGLP